MPRVSKVGGGHGGAQDYSTLSAWESAEFSVDYSGQQIVAECLGNLGSTWSLAGASVNGFEVYTDGVTYDGTNESSLAVANRITLVSGVTSSSAPGIIHDLYIGNTGASDECLNTTSDYLTLYNLRIVSSSIQALRVGNDLPNSSLKTSVLSGSTSDCVFFTGGHGIDMQNVVIFGASDKGIEAFNSPRTQDRCFSFGNAGLDFDTGALNLVDCASEDASGDFTGYTSSELVDFASNDFRTKSTSALATIATGGEFVGAFLETSTGITVTGQTANYNYSGVNGIVDLAGEISVIGQTASYTYQAINGTIDLTGTISVVGQTANYSYTAIQGSVLLTGEIQVTGQTANYDYNAIQGSIQLSGEILVTGQTANYNYVGVPASVSIFDLWEIQQPVNTTWSTQSGVESSWTIQPATNTSWSKK